MARLRASVTKAKRRRLAASPALSAVSGIAASAISATVIALRLPLITCSIAALVVSFLLLPWVSLLRLVLRRRLRQATLAKAS
jgi:hypothetical protein